MHSENQQTHRAGVLKQQNKAHKHGKHRSKGAIDTANKGRVPIKLATKRQKRELRRQDRRNQASQLRSKKREETLMKKRSLGCQGSPPFLSAIVPLSAGEDPKQFLELLKSCDDEAFISTNTQGHVYISSPRFKQRFTFFIPPAGDLYAVLDSVKVADTIIFLLSPEEGIDESGELILASLFGQGLPATVHVVQGLESLPIKKRNDVKKILTKQIEKRFPKEKVNFVDKASEALLVLRQIGSQKQRSVTARDKRAHLFADRVTFEPDETQMEGTLKISGYVRGKPLTVNGLVHIPGWKDFQLLQIDRTPDPHPLNLNNSSGRRKGIDSMCDESSFMEDDDICLEKANPAIQETLESTNCLDPMEGEQTWPTEEELREAQESLESSSAHSSKKRIVKRVPKGTSDYQAAWILDSEGEDGVEESDSDSQNDDDDEAILKQLHGLDIMEEEISDEDDDKAVDDDDYETMTVTEAGDAVKYDEKVDLDEEMYNLQKFKEARMNEMFPDEMDTPQDISARVRFQKYRGLKSFRTSLWDPKENLPADYTRIFQFENFDRTKKRVLGEDNDGAQPGWYVTLHISKVPKYLADSLSSEFPLVVYQPLMHEQKMSVANVVLKRVQTDAEPIKSKDRLVFHIGYRRFGVCPIFSQHTNGTKHKYERFLRSDVTTVATMYCPIIYPPSSVLVFREEKDGTHTLVATGSLLSINPDRIVVKRITLSGHPFKINKRSAVVRYLFFNKEDVLWFKPVELRTKYGRRGHIKEPLGTHGHIKCFFDGQLKSQDTILMNLYKRIFPKWNYDPCVVHPISSSRNRNNEEASEEML